MRLLEYDGLDTSGVKRQYLKVREALARGVSAMCMESNTARR